MRSIKSLFAALLTTTLVLAVSFCAAADDIPQPVARLFKKHCLECHNADAAEGDVVLKLEAIDWTSPETADKTIALWESVQTMLSKQIMPPPDSEQPAEQQRQKMLGWVHDRLIQHSPIGGTLLRRLNRREYANSIVDLFSLNEFRVPAGFPADPQVGGFDNQADALVLAPTHLEALVESSTSVANLVFPQPPVAEKSRSMTITPQDLVISYSSACVIDGALRLASGGTNAIRHASWPSRFEARTAGVYQGTIKVSTVQPPVDQLPLLKIETMPMEFQRGKSATARLVAEFEIQPGEPQVYSFEAELQVGETLSFRYSNAEFDYEDRVAYPEFLKTLFTAEPDLAAAWDKVGDPARGGSGWLKVKEALADPKLATDEFGVGSERVGEVIKQIARDRVSSGETLVYKYFEEGPNIGIHELQLNGPVRAIVDQEFERKRQHTAKFMGDAYGKADTKSLTQFFATFLSRAFRRPATAAEVSTYVRLVQSQTNQSQLAKSAQSESATGRSLEDGLHLAVRTALISPAFLYRGIGAGPLNDHELASRLAFFLTSRPPDASLRKIADAGKLRKASVLLKEAKRLIAVQSGKNRDASFAVDFTSGWLETSNIDRLMPDTRLIRQFNDGHRKAMQSEIELTFSHILKNNLPVTEFIAPDFLFTDPLVGWDIYGLDQFKPLKKKRNKSATADGKQKSVKMKTGMQLVRIPRDGRVGGLLCMSGLMMSTANGVDTQPVLRGVWVLNKIIGSPPPEPPNAVPALTPDTTGASTPKQRLAAHMSDSNCAVCHREIDPVGFALENFDPIGRWRDHYPEFEEEDGQSKTSDGLVVDATGTMPDGTKFENVTDLKKWLVDHPEKFASCLSEKLLTYATGRRLNYRERQLVAEIVKDQKSHNLQFRDLLLALIDSEIFRTK